MEILDSIAAAAEFDRRAKKAATEVAEVGSAERGSGSLIIFKAVTGDHRDVIRSAILAAKPATPQFDPIKTLCSARRVPGYPAAQGARPFFSGCSMRTRAYH